MLLTFDQPNLQEKSGVRWLRSEGLELSKIAGGTSLTVYVLILLLGGVLGVLLIVGEFVGATFPLISFFGDSVFFVMSKMIIGGLGSMVVLLFVVWIQIVTITLPARVFVSGEGILQSLWIEIKQFRSRVRDYLLFLLIFSLVHIVVTNVISSVYFSPVSSLAYYWCFVSIFVVEATLLHYEREHDIP